MAEIDRREFLKGSLAAAAGGALARGGAVGAAPEASPRLPKGRIGDLEVSRILLGGNLLTHYTHSRDLQYVYNLAAHYNTDEKIIETMRLAEANGIDTLVIHTVPHTLQVLRDYRYRHGGKMQWIICPTAPIDDAMEAYARQAKETVDGGADALYVWGVRGDELVAKGRVDLIAKAVEIGKDLGVPSGVGAHDLRVIIECERRKVGADFYIKTFHHHDYPTAPKPDEIKGPHAEIPGYWCSDPGKVIEAMAKVEKPWIAFKVMAAGAIPPASAFRYAFENGADHIIAGMFDFEIEEDVRIAKSILADLRRERPWRS